MLAHPAVFWGNVGDVALDDKALTSAEAGRAGRFRDQLARSRFVLGVSLLRLAVEVETGVSWPNFEVSRRCPDCGCEHGQPRLRPVRGTGKRAARHLSTTSVSVSHSGATVVVAVCAGALVGVDIEERQVRLMTGALDELVLHPAERTGRGPVTPDRLLRTWVRKEALLKATGEGLRRPPAGIALNGCGLHVAVRAWNERPDLVSRSAVADLMCPVGVVGAVAVVGDRESAAIGAVERFEGQVWARGRRNRLRR